MAVTVSIINLKGGVGKSTITMMVAEYLFFHHRKRVLVIDLDSQHNLTQAMVRPNFITSLGKEEKDIYHLFQQTLQGKQPKANNFVARPPLIVSNISRWGDSEGLDMIIALPDLGQLDEEMLKMWQRGDPAPKELHFTLKNSLDSARKEYDVILIDCPPGLSLMTSNAMVASDFFVAPVIPEPLSMLGIDLVKTRVAELKYEYPQLTIEFAGTIFNKVLHYRNTHRIIGPWLAGAQVGDLAPIPASQYKVFHRWIPDSERIRKIAEFQNEELQEQLKLEKFGHLSSKYDGSSRLSNPAPPMWFSRAGEEGPVYHLWERLNKVTQELMARVGIN